uniref:Uncharacterized protein n=1 Tax=Lygus hesperus TaxID=30085 RepID=A0A146L7N9_LYGHE
MVWRKVCRYVRKAYPYSWTRVAENFRVCSRGNDRHVHLLSSIYSISLLGVEDSKAGYPLVRGSARGRLRRGMHTGVDGRVTRAKPASAWPRVCGEQANELWDDGRRKGNRALSQNQTIERKAGYTLVRR